MIEAGRFIEIQKAVLVGSADIAFCAFSASESAFPDASTSFGQEVISG